jgi:hypothetical protein
VLTKRHKPAALMLKYVGLLFTALDASAAPFNTGLLEPPKCSNWCKLVPSYRDHECGFSLWAGPRKELKSYYKNAGVPYYTEIVGPALNRAGLLQLLVQLVLQDPQYQHESFCIFAVIYDLPIHFVRQQFPLRANQAVAGA